MKIKRKSLASLKKYAYLCIIINKSNNNFKTINDMVRVTNKVLNNSIERFNTLDCLNGKEIFESSYDKMPRLFLTDKKTNSTVFIFEGTKSQCCTFLLSLSTFLIANGMGNK